jgi:uncharacterized membrane protein YkvA (DUF1232 family)
MTAMPWWGWLLLGLLAVALALVGVAFLLRSRLRRLRRDPLVRRIGDLPLTVKLRLVGRLLRDRRVPWWAKALLPALALYLAMPFDLIPDFIPVVGYLDDLLLLLVVAALLRRALPHAVVEENVGALEATSAEGRGR